MPPLEIRWRAVRIIFLRELRDVLRDRRTLFTMLVLPVLLYPALMLGFGKLVTGLSDKIRKEGFEVAVSVEGVPLSSSVNPEEGSFLARLTAEKSFRLKAIDGDPNTAITEGRLHLLLDLPQSATLRGLPPSPIELSPVFASSNDRSKAAFNVLSRLAAEHRLDLAPLTVVETGDLASAEERGGHAFGGMLAMLVLFMALTGTFYPALDVAAGEKERGTLETLLLTPVSRGELVLGKYFTVLVVAVGAALANLGSLALTFQSFSGLVGRSAPGGGGFEFSVTPGTFFIIFAGLVALSGLFSAVSLALSTFARSYKEGQSYLTPVFLVVLPLGMVGLLPAIKLDLKMAMVPVANVALLMKARLMGESVLVESAVCCVSLVGLALVALAWCRQQFEREDVLFREGAPLFMLRPPPGVPKATEPRMGTVIFGYFLLLAVVYFAGTRLAGDPLLAFFVLMGALAFLPPLLLNVTATKVFEGLALRRPSARFLLGAALLGLGAPSLSLGVGQLQELWLGKPDAAASEGLRVFLDLGLWSRVLLMAVVPGIAEEVFFRGFLLRGLSRGVGLITSVVLAALVFAQFHMSAYRFWPQLVMGLLLGYALVRGRSLWLPALAHALHNAVLVVIASLGEGDGAAAEEEAPKWLFFAGYPLLIAGLLIFFRRSGEKDGASP